MKSLFILYALAFLQPVQGQDPDLDPQDLPTFPAPVKGVSIDKSWQVDASLYAAPAVLGSDSDTEIRTFYATWPEDVGEDDKGAVAVDSANALNSHADAIENHGNEDGEETEHESERDDTNRVTAIGKEKGGSFPESSAAGLRLYTPFVQNIALIEGNNPNIACPPYHGKINVDLNLSAGGPYIFICYGKSDSIADTLGAIEGVTVEAASAENPYAKIQGCRTYSSNRCISYFVNAIAPSTGDLNHGVGGAFIYLAKSVRPCINGACDPGANPNRLRLRELAIVTGPTMDIPCPASYTKLPVDLNQQTVATTKIFLCQLLKPESE